MTWMLRVLVPLLVILGASCSSTQVAMYRSPNWSGYTDRIAVLPMVVTPAIDSRDSGHHGPTWIRDSGRGDPISEEEYRAAEVRLVQQIREVWPKRELVLPMEVDAAMRKQKDEDPMRPPMAAGLSARRTNSHAALLVTVSDYRANGTAGVSGATQMALYDPKGDVIWTLSGDVKNSSGQELADLVSTATRDFADGLEEAMESED